MIDVKIRKKRLNLVQKRYKANKIIELVNDYFNIECNVPYRNREIIIPRQIAIYLICENIFMSYAEIGKLFLSRKREHLNHATIYHSKCKIGDLLDVDKETIKHYTELKEDAKYIARLDELELKKYKAKEKILLVINDYDIKELNELYLKINTNKL